jgi:hypothetical protein
MPTNNEFDSGLPSVQGPRDADNPGYETQDVNVGGIVTFIGGLVGFVAVFFLFCFLMGKIINDKLADLDGPTDKWHTATNSLGYTPRGEKRENLESNSAIEQKQLQGMTKAFPTPRLQTDDGNQDTADLHAKEDLLLDNYSTSNDLPAGAVRIPIERAMELIAQRGLPKAPASTTSTTLMAGESKPKITAPLTTGFARTGYELQYIESREQRVDFNHAEAKQ